MLNCWNKIKEGDKKPFELLFKGLFSELCNYAFQYTADRILSEKVVQDVFLNIWQNRENIIPGKSIKVYIIQEVHNSCINRLIQKKNINNVFLPEESLLFIQESTQINSFLLEKLESEDTERIIKQIIQTLPVVCREIFTLSRFENKSNQEIAEKLNVTVGTVRSQIYNALEKISEGTLKYS